MIGNGLVLWYLLATCATVAGIAIAIQAYRSRRRHRDNQE